MLGVIILMQKVSTMPIPTMFAAEHSKKQGGLRVRRDQGNTRCSFGQAIALICCHRLSKMHLTKLTQFVLHVAMKQRRDKLCTEPVLVEKELNPWVPIVRRQYSPVTQYTSEGDRSNSTKRPNHRTKKRDEERRALATCTYTRPLHPLYSP